MNVESYARRRANGEIKAKEEKRRVSPVEKYAAKRAGEARATAKPERPKREERSTRWTETTETEN